MAGNQNLIKKYKNECVTMMTELNEEMAENQSFSNFKNIVEKDLKKQQQFEELRKQEKAYNSEIKKINEDLKKKQDDFAKEA